MVLRVGARGGDEHVARAADVPARLREQTRERDARVRFPRTQAQNLAIQSLGGVVVAAKLLQPRERVRRLDVPGVAGHGARQVLARHSRVAAAARRLRPRGQHDGLRAPQRRRRLGLRLGLLANLRLRILQPLLRRRRGALGVVQHAERAFEEPVGGNSVVGAELHHRPLP